MLDFDIPGHGEKSSEYCGSIIGAKYCSDCGHLEPMAYHCHNWHCPECYYSASIQAAKRLEDRLLGVSKAYAYFGKHLGKIYHFTFSLPSSEYADFDLDKAYKKLRKYLEMVGVTGGAYIFHPYRIHDKYNKPIYDALKDADLKGGNWRGVHKDILNLGNWKKYVYFAPHFHVLGFFDMKMKSNEFQNLTGWIYRNITPYAARNVYLTARYVLTHHAVLKGHAVRYFGFAAYNKTSTSIISETVVKKCPVCNSENFYRFSCFSYEYEDFLSGKKQVNESDLFLHVRLKLKKKYYFVNSKQSKLDF